MMSPETDVRPSDESATESSPVSDRGMTLVELIVAMGIFTVIIAVFMSGVVIMTRDTARGQAVSDAGTEVNRVFQRLDQDVRYASAINLPWFGVDGSFYVEYLITAVNGGEKPLCTQWRYVPATSGTEGILESRTWRDVATPAPTGWVRAATGVRNNLAVPAERPFKVTVTLKQQMHVILDVGPGTGGPGARKGAGLDAEFVARNTTDQTATRNDKNGDNVSDTPVCQSGGMGRS